MWSLVSSTDCKYSVDGPLLYTHWEEDGIEHIELWEIIYIYRDLGTMSWRAMRKNEETGKLYEETFRMEIVSE